MIKQKKRRLQRNFDRGWREEAEDARALELRGEDFSSEMIWHISESQGQNLALAFKQNGSIPVSCPLFARKRSWEGGADSQQQHDAKAHSENDHAKAPIVK